MSNFMFAKMVFRASLNITTINNSCPSTVVPKNSRQIHSNRVLHTVYVGATNSSFCAIKVVLCCLAKKKSPLFITKKEKLWQWERSYELGVKMQYSFTLRNPKKTGYIRPRVITCRKGFSINRFLSLLRIWKVQVNVVWWSKLELSFFLRL